MFLSPFFSQKTAGVFFALFLMWAPFAPAEEVDKEISPETALKVIETYFNTLQTFEAEFHQVSEAAQVGSSSLQGTFYLHRPRKFLWQYKTPSRQKLVSTGGQLFFYDPDTSQISQLPLNSGLAGFLTSEKITLQNEYFTPRGVHITPKVLEVNLKSKEKDMPVQNLTISLWRNPVRLGKLTTTDTLGRKTYTFFKDVKEGHAIPSKIFKFDPYSLDQ